jgi:hypothetical protein
MAFPDDTNIDHPYQGRLRFAPLGAGLRDRCATDLGSDGYKLVLTHLDQLPLVERADLYSYGPTHASIQMAPSRLRPAA